jgi:hypothetical protein
MPHEIKSADGKDVRAVGILCNSSRCGVCDCVIIDKQNFWTLDAPYNCLVHATCLQFFAFDGKTRLDETEAQKKTEEAFDADAEIMAEFMSRPFFQKRLPEPIRVAITRVYLTNLALRENYSPHRQAARRIRAVERVKTNNSEVFRELRGLNDPKRVKEIVAAAAAEEPKKE